MPGLLPHIDPNGLLEYSVVFTDRSLNHMSQRFQGVLRDVLSTLKSVYHAEEAILLPGGGTCAMEAVARQWGQGAHCMVIRNGFFSFRWSQILEMGQLSKSVTVLKAFQPEVGFEQPYTPPRLEDVLEAIASERPQIMFVPHVETASGILLPDDYLAALAKAIHAVDGLLVVDCVASGAMWLNMEALDIDILITAPQKGWSGMPGFGMVMLKHRAIERLDQTKSNSFALDIKKWREIMQAYENGGFAYHATMPTDAIVYLHEMMKLSQELGWDVLKSRQLTLGRLVREALASRGFRSVAHKDFAAPGVVVNYTQNPTLHNAQGLISYGIQVAAGVPLQCDESTDYRSFRIGLFGIDKLKDIDGTVARLMNGLDQFIATL